MYRLFVALRPSAGMRQALLGTMGGVPGARWQDDDQLHVTLRFLGEVNRHQAEDLAIALANVRTVPVQVRIEGTGAFERRNRVHTLWAGVRADDALLRLQASIERAATRIGLPPEGRAFHPHVTVARLAADRGSVEPWLARTAALTAPSERHDAFILFESHLGRDGARYHAIERYTLSD